MSKYKEIQENLSNCNLNYVNEKGALCFPFTYSDDQFTINYKRIRRFNDKSISSFFNLEQKLTIATYLEEILRKVFDRRLSQKEYLDIKNSKITNMSYNFWRESMINERMFKKEAYKLIKGK
jgi:hypothetical protein